MQIVGGPAAAVLPSWMFLELPSTPLASGEAVMEPGPSVGAREQGRLQHSGGRSRWPARVRQALRA